MSRLPYVNGTRTNETELQRYLFAKSQYNIIYQAVEIFFTNQQMNS